MKTFKNFVILLFVIFFYEVGFSQDVLKRSFDITSNEIIYHIKYLSSEKFHGRRTGEKWCDSAGAYIENEFKQYGLKPIQNDFRQYYEFVSSLKLAGNNSFNITGSKKTYLLEKDFIPLSISSSQKVSGGLLFAGYGISLPDSDYDDYKNMDVKGKIVMVLNGLPDDNNKSKFSRFRSIRNKVSSARDKGAKGIIVVSNSDESDGLMKLKYDMASSNSGIVVINITKKTAEDIFTSNGFNLNSVQQKIMSNISSQSFEFKNILASIQVDVQEVKTKSFNVIGFIEGNDPNLKDQFIVLGAHYDHLGMGGDGSLVPDTVGLHGGADDNASGTAGVLELAQALENEKTKIGRSIVFMSFSGEEEGLLGSAAYIKNPLIPLEKTVAMVNMDMIGRLRDKKLIVNGAGSAQIFERLLKKYNSDSTFNLKTTDDGFSPSDNSSFYGKNIPVMMFFTDLHLDYHKPADTWDKINTEGEKSILKYIKNVVIDLSNEKDKPVYIKPKVDSSKRREMTAFKVSSGIIPEFGEKANGFKIQGTRPGSPSDKAGLKGGDVIIKVGDLVIKDIYDYMTALGEYKPGDKTKVIWIRDGKEMNGIMEFVKK